MAQCQPGAVDSSGCRRRRPGLSLLAIVGAATLLSPRPSAADAMIAALKADHVVVEKAERRLILYRDGRPLRSYRVALGRQPVGAKRRAGDGRTPEGNYVLDWRNAGSRFYKSMHVSYPNAGEVARAHEAGADPGGLIMIHGLSPLKAPLGADHARRDWTEGCIAVTNAEMDEIWRLVDDGTPITIRP